MAITGGLYIAIDKVRVPEGRQRSEVGDCKDLVESVKLQGFIHPIVLRDEGGEKWLVSGERRLTTAKLLGMLEIPYRVLVENSELDRRAVELDENIRRKDISWQNSCKAIAEYHETARQFFGKWSSDKTAEAIGLSETHVERILLVHRYIYDERVATSATLTTAASLADRLKKKAIEAESNQIAVAMKDLDKLILMPEALKATPDLEIKLPETKPLPPNTAQEEAERLILNQNFLEWVAEYDGPGFNLAHCDFPYGIEFHDSDQGGQHRGTYDDSEGTYLQLLEAFTDNMGKILSPDALIIFWLSMNYYDKTREVFAKRGAQVLPNPLIWYKSDRRGIVSDVKRRPRHVYETALMIRWGDPTLLTPADDCYPCPTVRGGHAAEKPQPMLQHFFSMFVDEHTSVLDPTCGSGSAIRAAHFLKANRVLGLEKDQAFCSDAQTRLADQIRKARAAEVLMERTHVA
jgi:ParB/RepB/Spo0J family partition protein